MPGYITEAVQVAPGRVPDPVAGHGHCSCCQPRWYACQSFKRPQPVLLQTQSLAVMQSYHKVTCLAGKAFEQEAQHNHLFMSHLLQLQLQQHVVKVQGNSCCGSCIAVPSGPPGDWSPLNVALDSVILQAHVCCSSTQSGRPNIWGVLAAVAVVHILTAST